MKKAFWVLIIVAASGSASAQDKGKDEPKAPDYRVLICQTVCGGQCKRLYDLLVSKYGYSKEHITVLGNEKELEPIPHEEPSKANVSKHLEELSKEMGEKDHLVVLLTCHMRQGCLIADQLPYAEFNALLKNFKEGVEITVIMEGCHSGWAIPAISNADRVYASCGPMEMCYGYFLSLMIDALGSKEEAFQQADTDLDGRVSLGEAYDYASNKERLRKSYETLPPNVWPKGWIAYPDKGKNVDEYQTFIGKTEPGSKPLEGISPAVRRDLSSIDCKEKKEVIRILSQKEKEVQGVLNKTKRELKKFLPEEEIEKILR